MKGDPTDDMHNLAIPKQLCHRFYVGAIVAAGFIATAFIVDQWDLLAYEWQVGLWLIVPAWMVPVAAESFFAGSSDCAERRDISRLVREVSYAMVLAFSRASPEAKRTVDEHGYPGALQEVLRAGRAIHIPSAVDAGGPASALARWRSIESAVAHLRPSVEKYISHEARLAYSQFLFKLGRVLDSIEVAKKNSGADLAQFEGEVQSELESVTGMLRRIVAMWLELWGEETPDPAAWAPVGKRALENIKRTITRANHNHYLLWRKHGYTVSLE